ncbi:transcriptional regulator FilR1 domain-containing protein [Saliphagus sp. LR7]|uniref:transcriptional regulator FilR1 domain-containing protein n=1 Tax=Saliphagus sp. LR7 TaxID=2282654 RepID=UPI001E39CF96|nr:transcriptional regulator FilR1 domain-containing protein [Saliphagus sp. LR7]
MNSHSAGIEFTGGGKLLLDAVDTHLQDVERVELAFHTRSAHPVDLLRTLARHPCREDQLQSTTENGPSQRTVRRVLSTFQEYGWSRTDGNRHGLTTDGKQAAEQYDILEESVAQLVWKAQWVQRLPIEAATVPLTALADADVTVTNPFRPWQGLGTAFKLFDRKITRFRALCSVYNPFLFHAYRANLEAGVDCEAILDLSTLLDVLERPHLAFVISSTAYKNYRPLIHEESLTLGIGIYDDRKIAVGAYNEQGDGEHIAILVSTNDEIVEWGIDLYERYRENTHPVDDVIWD